jgi:septal ring factor EnvC (AmiA/AmiB activator)
MGLPSRMDVHIHGGNEHEDREILFLLHHLDHKVDAILEHLVTDPTALKALTDKIAAKTAELQTAVDAATTPSTP